MREAAVGALEGLGPPAAGQIAELAALTQDANADVAYWAVTLLGRLGVAAEPALPALIQAFQPPTALAVRQRAAWAIGQAGRVAISARPALIAAAADPDPRLARLAQEALRSWHGELGVPSAFLRAMRLGRRDRSFNASPCGNVERHPLFFNQIDDPTLGRKNAVRLYQDLVVEVIRLSRAS